jgi:hypothetical protein
MPKRLVNKDEVLDLIKQGQSDSQIVKLYAEKGIKVSRQAIRLYREKKPCTVNPEQRFRELQDVLLQVMKDAKAYEEAVKEANSWKNKYYAMKNEYDVLKSDYDEITRSQREFKSLVNQGMIPEPLVTFKK